MSYILDALKKLEHEKNRKTRGNGMSDITGELLRNDRQDAAGGGSGKKIVLITVLVSLVTFGATCFFLKPAKNIAVPVTQRTVPVPAAPQPAPSNPAPEPLPSQPQAEQNSNTVTTTVSVPKPVGQHPVKPASATPAPVPVSAKQLKKQRDDTVKPSAQSVEDAAALITIQELKKRMKAPSAPTMAPPADIKLSGIAWQDEPRARRAVINGFLMQEGGVVSGARITEILPDRVRFSLSGGVFELSLAASAGK